MIFLKKKIIIIIKKKQKTALNIRGKPTLYAFRQRTALMAWSWTVVESGWISPSQKDLTPQPRESTWDDPRSKSKCFLLFRWK